MSYIKKKQWYHSPHEAGAKSLYLTDEATAFWKNVEGGIIDITMVHHCDETWNLSLVSPLARLVVLLYSWCYMYNQCFLVNIGLEIFPMVRGLRGWKVARVQKREHGRWETSVYKQTAYNMCIFYSIAETYLIIPYQIWGSMQFAVWWRSYAVHIRKSLQGCCLCFSSWNSQRI